MKKLFGALALMLMVAAAPAQAADSGFPLEKAPHRINDMASLQNGAKLFVNHCLNCHSANSLRYNKLQEIGLTDAQIRDNLLFTGEKVGDMMRIPMTPADAKKWFGTTPPDLSVIARAKSINAGPSGSDYLYTYLRTFYRDASKATGWDNLVFPSVGMPHAMWEREGPRELTKVAVHKTEGTDGKPGGWERVTTQFDVNGYSTVKTEPLVDYKGGPTFQAQFTSKTPGASVAFDNDIADLVGFMTWMSEPNQSQRKRIGVWVMLYLAVFLVIAWRLNAVYWKDVK
jgi:ubiquinol-cytochrome c reductase cytochrome c1 subunit